MLETFMSTRFAYQRIDQETSSSFVSGRFEKQQ